MDLDTNNNTPLVESFNKRILYKFLSLSVDGVTPTLEKSGVKDYWLFENYFYGKVDNDFLPVVPNIDKLVQLEGQDGSVLVFDFVAESFNKFRSFFATPLRLGRLESGTPISDPVPYAGFKNNESLYQQDLIDFSEIFNSYIFDQNIYNYIKTERDYVKEFFKFYFNGTRPILRSSYYLSNRVSNQSSGLSILLADLDPSDDKVKTEFLESPNFEFYRKAAINAGFLIDKNIPWKINIDLSSPVILEKYSSEKIDGVSFKDQVFRDYFTYAYTGELTQVLQTIFYGYRDYFEKRPALSHPSEIDYCDVNLPPKPSFGAIASSYKKSWWDGKYIEMKNKEAGNPYSEQKIKYIKNNAFSLRVADNTQYINLKFRLPYIEPGSLVYEKLKQEFRESGEKVLDNFSEHVKMIVMNSINSIY